MGRDGKETNRRSRKRSRDASPSSDSGSSGFPSSVSSPSSSPVRRRCSSKRKRSSSSSHRHRRSRESSGRSRSSRDEERRRRRRRRRDEERRQRVDDEGGSPSSGSEGGQDRAAAEEAREIVRDIIGEFPAVAGELCQLLDMVDSGEGIDISGISDKPLVKRLKKLFRSLRLKESASGVYLLPTKNVRTLNIVGPLLLASSKLADSKNGKSISPNREQLSPANSDVQNKDKDDTTSEGPKNVDVKEESPKKRIIGPAMPSRELLAAAAEMTEALRCRDAELEGDDDLLIGPPPPAVVAEAASVNEAERFEEVTRILAADSKSPYDVLGVNWKMSTDNMKKRYWKLSLLVHPDKCPHPSAQEAFVKLNNAFKDLQDPDKRGAIDDEIKKKEEIEQFEIELKAMREAAEWRRLQDRLAKHGLPHQIACPFCDQEESIQHILSACVLTREVWESILRMLRLDMVPVATSSSRFGAWWCKATAALPKEFQKGFNSLVILVAWEVWKHRNACVFYRVRPQTQAVLDRVAEEGHLWCLSGASNLHVPLLRSAPAT